VAEQLALPRDRELSEGEIHEIAQRVQARAVSDPSAERKALAEHKPHIALWLGRKRPLRLSKIHTLLVRDHGVVASYDTLRRYAMEELGWQKKEATILLEDPPAGQEAQIDFGKMGMMLDDATGRMRAIWVRIVTLSFSRYPFVWPTFVQTTEAVCEGLDRAWWFFGAMSRTIVPDNMSSVIKKSDRKVPRDAFEATEKSLMLAPPTSPFDVPLWAENAKVHPDHHIQIARALYSVPTLYRSKLVRVRADKTTVKIYFGTDLIKLHPRKPPGGRSTDTSDYPVGKADYALRSVDGLIAKAKGKGVHVGTYAERLLGGPLPWTRMRQAYALLRLCEKYGDDRASGKDKVLGDPTK